jgi:hypothetical protein
MLIEVFDEGFPECFAAQSIYKAGAVHHVRAGLPALVDSRGAGGGQAVCAL